MHIQLSISPHCPSFLINARLVGVNKHIHSGPKNKSTLCLKSREGANAASPLCVTEIVLSELFYALDIYMTLIMY